MKTNHSTSTASGKFTLAKRSDIIALAAELRRVAEDPDQQTGTLKIGPFTFKKGMTRLNAAAALILKNDPWKPVRQPNTDSTRDAIKDALRVYGTAENASETITRHLQTQGKDIDPKVTARAEKLLSALVPLVMKERANAGPAPLVAKASPAPVAMDQELGALRKELAATHSMLQSTREELAASKRAHQAEVTALRQSLAARETGIPACFSSTVPDPLSPISSNSTSPTLTRNPDKNGIELRFPVKPAPDTLAALKRHGFRWASKQDGQPWWVKYSEEAWVFANSLRERGLQSATGSAEFIPAFIHSSSSGPCIEIATTEPSPERHEEESPAAFATAFADF